MASNVNDVAINMNNLAENDENASNSNSNPRPSRTLSPNRADAPVSSHNNKKIFSINYFILLQRPTSRKRSRSPRVSRSTDTTVPLLDTKDAEEFSPDGDPPMANPEMDEDEFQDDRPTGRPEKGVDDGFFPEEPRRRNNGPSLNNGGTDINTNGANPRNVGPFPYGPNFTPQGVVS